MKNQGSIDRTSARKLFVAVPSVLAIMALVAASALVVSSREVSAKPEFGQKTGLPCGQCHTNPGGSGKLKSFGEKFKANGNKIK